MKKQLKLSDFRPKLPFNINYGMADIEISRVLKYPEDYQFDFDVFLPSKNKNLQRPLVWSLLQKQELILSILKGVILPPITILQKAERDVKKSIYKVIDGKQRICTIISFIEGEFPIIVDGTEYYFGDLSKDMKFEIGGGGRGYLRSNIGYEYWNNPISDDILIQWFEMINFAGTPQDKEHLENLKK